MKLSIFNSSDFDEIKQLFTKTFSDSEGQEEGLVIGSLSYDLMTTTKKDDFFGFIAIDNKKIVASVFFTRLSFDKSDVNAFILSPMATQTNYQGKGIGQKLINFGLNSLKENNVELIFTYGDPKFYSKVRFTHIDEKTIKAPFKLEYPEGWLCQSLISNEINPITGRTTCVEALNNPDLW